MTANQSGYGNPGMGGSPWGAGAGAPAAPWGHPWAWYYYWPVKPLLIGATVLGFIAWWPIGLALLFFLLGSRRMGCWGRGRPGTGSQDAPPWAGWQRNMRNWCAAPPSSGNRAFDEYRAETLRRLEEEQKDFATFLDRLRFAKDKAEFDQFMAERRQRPPTAPDEPTAPPQA